MCPQAHHVKYETYFTTWYAALSVLVSFLFFSFRFVSFSSYSCLELPLIVNAWGLCYSCSIAILDDNMNFVNNANYNHMVFVLRLYRVCVSSSVCSVWILLRRFRCFMIIIHFIKHTLKTTTPTTNYVHISMHVYLYISYKMWTIKYNFCTNNYF